jgi:hypothetical protein
MKANVELGRVDAVATPSKSIYLQPENALSWQLQSLPNDVGEREWGDLQ